MKKRCSTCPYFLCYTKLSEQLKELEFWEKILINDYNKIKQQPTKDQLTEQAETQAEITLGLQKILCALKLIYHSELKKASSVGVKK